MKVLIFGHSDTDGSRLPDAERGLPRLLERMVLDATGESPEVVHRTLYGGPTARTFVERELERHNPDVVIVCTTTHGVVVQLVSNRIRERWGERAARLAERAEQSAAAISDRLAPGGSSVLSAARRSARRILGTRPALTPEQLIEYYDGVLTAIASREHIHGVISGGIGYIGTIRELNPALDPIQARMQQSFRRSAESRHFAWISQEQVLGGPGHKERYYQPDGMHTDERSHQLFAEALLPLILARR